MRLAAAALALLLAPAALAQKDYFFGSGKPPLFREEETDRRLLKSKLGRALEQGTQDPNCVQLVGALLAVLAEIGPSLHRRDENFTVDPMLLQAVQTQLTTPRFPAAAYLSTMVRRVLIDRKLPDNWLTTAGALNQKVMIIDVGKLRFLNEGIRPIDSFMFTLPALRDRYELEVLRATRAATQDVVADFRDAYLDRDVAWGGAILLDAGLTAPQKKGQGKKPPPPPEDEAIVALLHWEPPMPSQNQLMFFAVKKPPPVKIIAKLAPRQFIDLSKVPRGKRMLVRGRFWEMNRAVTEVEIREALLFEDRDWSQGALLADPQAVAYCPLAVNELTGLAPRQPGGFAH
ncbi:MAG: hypothetical protein HYZ28_27140 [Myxococcales bacterium]|nr:hypothetical protein [Myxococcales bacterium]